MSQRKGKEPEKSTQSQSDKASSYQANAISFVSFDGSSANDASRKAVRKQAALSSAAARKATIAKKVAQQKSEDERRRQTDDTAGAIATEKREGVKRKRSAEEPAIRGLWQAGVSIIESSPLPSTYQIGAGSIPDKSAAGPQPNVTPTQRTGWPTEAARSAGPWQSGISIVDSSYAENARMLPRNAMLQQRYSPETSLAIQGNVGTNRHTTKAPLVRPPSPPSDDIEVIQRTSSADTQSLATSLLAASAEVPHAYSREIMPLVMGSGWPVMSEDYENLEDDRPESYVPMTPESLASPQTHSASIMDPFNQYPVPYHPIYDRLLHYMLTIFAPRGWSSLRITHQEGLAYEGFMTQHALAEPALFLVRLLFASGDLINQGVLDRRVAIALRTLAIQAINEALSDSRRCVSDGLILAVGRIALTETLYGDKSAASTHRPAQRRMINMRGGMKELDFPPLIKRLMRWSDRVMSIQTNTPRLLPDDEDQGNTTLTMNESLNLIEDWAPQEGKAMRKKIAIADLIT